MEEYIVTATNIINKQNTNIIIVEDYDEISDDTILSAKLNGKIIQGRSYYYFEAFKELRDKLLALNYGLKCKGSMLNVVQSNMASTCEKIYVIELGKQALLKNLVSIYEYADINEFVSSKEQNDFEARWHKSLRTNNSIDTSEE